MKRTDVEARIDLRKGKALNITQIQSSFGFPVRFDNLSSTARSLPFGDPRSGANGTFSECAIATEGSMGVAARQDCYVSVVDKIERKYFSKLLKPRERN